MSKKNSESASTDLRVRRTHKLLWEALLRLFQRHPYESITVQQICDEAMVHRTTFYNHFEDKDHLLMYGLEQIDKQFSQESVRDRLLKPTQTAEKIMDENKFTPLKTSESDGKISRMLYKHGMEGLKKDLRELEESGVKFPLPLEVIAAFVSGARIALCAWWMENGRKESAAQIDEYLQQMINPKLFSKDA
ncbi:TetR/AcrR family transcriptional regulator [Cohnella thailandensis]|uniref:TetR/AcrR family transcriptional regulator n=1 Tax=Cohnella thailandensis TaxID=557557 RepID=A0A841SUQ4_9BACL|nr:TetR/AcrR family transcriptional regulator [Cohnella thailandensis]MBB6633610.1 TetR/AcrR family transcriptional regulator [Cohnella thailandensis]MBP1976394.1 AcrR family transcriptional regulator [Cohnella thailandensis]